MKKYVINIIVTVYKCLSGLIKYHLDLEYLFKKVQSTQNNPEKSDTEIKVRHEPFGWSMFIRWSFDKKRK